MAPSYNDSESDQNQVLEVDDDWLYNSCPDHCRIYIKDHGAAVLGFSIRLNCSRQAINDLLTLIGIHMPATNRMLKSLTLLKNSLGAWLEDDITAVEYCEDCHAVWPKDTPDLYNCSTTGCNG